MEVEHEVKLDRDDVSVIRSVCEFCFKRKEENTKHRQLSWLEAGD